MFLAIFLRRARRVLICLKRSLPKALQMQSVLMFVLFVFSHFYFEGSVSYGDVLWAMLLILAAMWGIFFIRQLSEYGFNIYHRSDDDFIGGAFTGLGKKSIFFEAGLELYSSERYTDALNIFTGLEDDVYRKTDEEKGILAYYRARCYYEGGMYRNALINYDRANELGLQMPELPLIIADCCVREGEFDRAEEIYLGLIDGDSRYSEVIRLELGRMYLNRNDGENALKWFNEAIDRHEGYSEALAGKAIALTLLGRIDEGEEFYHAALLNYVGDPDGFTSHFKRIQAAMLLKPSSGADDNQKESEENV